MTRVLPALASLLLYSTFASPQSSEPARPRITGIAHVAIYVDDIASARHFYGGALGYAQSSPNVFDVNEHQSIELESAPKSTSDRVAHIAFATDSAEAMRHYLASRDIKVPDHVNHGRNGSLWFSLTDPSGQSIEFIEEKPRVIAKPAQPPASRQIIHVGFIVRDRAAEERFYKDILGFRTYWHGGMEPDRTDWVALQVPDGTVWIEEMLGASEHPSVFDLGVLNHFSLGVEKIDSVIPALQLHHWTPATHDQDRPQLGKDGKWQFNIYDPDLTRVEYMEFRPAQPPCCSDFAGPHPHD